MSKFGKRVEGILEVFEFEIVYSLNFLITIDLRRGTREGCFDVA